MNKAKAHQAIDIWSNILFLNGPFEGIFQGIRVQSGSMNQYALRSRVGAAEPAGELFVVVVMLLLRLGSRRLERMTEG